MEVHHLCPLSEVGKEYQIDPIRDLRPVCPNCHAMIHRQTPALPISELKAAIAKQRGM
ncbi:MAG: HNH endonuclease [Phycisphaerae bacterium]